MPEISDFESHILIVKDINVAKQFYADHFQMKVDHKFNIENEGQIRLLFGKSSIQLVSSASLFDFKNKDTVYGSSVLSLLSDINLSKWIQYFKLVDINIERGPEETIFSDGSFNSIFVFDPDGNIIKISNKVNTRENIKSGKRKQSGKNIQLEGGAYFKKLLPKITVSHKECSLSNSMIQKGTLLQSCFLIISGDVYVYDKDTKAHKLDAGNTIGFAEVLTNQPLNSDYRIDGEVKAISFSSKVVRDALEKANPLILGIGKYVHDRILALKERNTHFLIDSQFLSKLDFKLPAYSATKGDIIYRLGSTDRSFYYIESGKLLVRSALGEIIAELGPGQSFGESGALTGLPRSVSIEAETDSMMFVVGEKIIKKALASESAMTQLVCLALTRQLRFFNEKGFYDEAKSQ